MDKLDKTSPNDNFDRKVDNEKPNLENQQSVTPPPSTNRGTKRNLVELFVGGEPQDDGSDDSDTWDPQRDEFLRKIQEIKKLKAKDAETDRMKPSHSRKSLADRHWYLYDFHLETIRECGECGEPGSLPQNSVPQNENRVESKIAHSQIVRCKIPINVATASPTPSSSSRSVMYRRLQSEHLQLQRSFALLRQLVQESCNISDPEKQSSWEEEKEGLLQATKLLQTKVGDLQEKLHEYQEQNELLEFRILELDHCQAKTNRAVRDYGCNTDFCSGRKDHSTVPNGKKHVCLDSFEHQIAQCQDLDVKVGSLQEELKKVAAFPGLSCVQRRAIAQSASCVSQCQKDLTLLWGNVRSLNARMEGQNIEKLEVDRLPTNNDQLVNSWATDDNNQSHQNTDTEEESLLETSMTESQLQSLETSWEYCKSDDSDTSASSVLTPWKQGMVRPQEPDLFDGNKTDVSNSLLTSASEDEGLGDDQSRRDDSTGPSSLNTDYREANNTDHLTGLQDSIDDPNETELTYSYQNGGKYYDSDIRTELEKQLFRVRNQLEQAEESVVHLKMVLRSKEDQIEQLMAESGPNESAKTILELEERLADSEGTRSELHEQVLELEEAENDARLESQNLQTLVTNLRYREIDLENDLAEAKEKLEEYEREVMSTGALNDELRSQISYLQELVCQYEDKIFELEREDIHLKEQMRREKFQLRAPKEISHAQTEVDFNQLMERFEQSTQTCEAPIAMETDDFPAKSLPLNNSCSLLNRLISLEKKDGHLQTQLHQMDGTNLKLWGQLHAVDAGIERCRQIEGHLNDVSGELNDPDSRLEELLTLTAERLTDPSKEKESKLRDRLIELETINREFEKDLGVREKLCQDKDKNRIEWAQKEAGMNETIRSLRNDKSALQNLISNLEMEKRALLSDLEDAEKARSKLIESNRQETLDLKEKHQQSIDKLNDEIGAMEVKIQSYEKRIHSLEADKSSTGTNDDSLKLQIKSLKNEQASLRELVVSQADNVAAMNQSVAQRQIAIAQKQKAEEVKLNEEISALKEREANFVTRLTEMEEQRTKLETSLASKEEELNRTKVTYEKKLMLLEEEHHLVEKELKWRLKEMEDGTKVAVMALEQKRKQLESNLKEDLRDLRFQEDSYKGRIKVLEKHVDHLRQEVSNFTAFGSFDADTGLSLGEPPSLERVSLKPNKQERKQETEVFESHQHQSLKDRVIELEKKESAYVETLENADKIISEMEASYRQKIGELETTEKMLHLRVSQLEESENVLKCSLQSERRATDGWRISDLVKELVEAESREHSLKEQLEELDCSQRTLLLRNRETERANQQLQEELREHDDLLASMENLKLNQETLKEEVNQLRQSELALKETLRQADAIMAQRELGLTRKVTELEEEKRDTLEVVHQLRDQVRLLEMKLENAQMEKSILERGRSKVLALSRESESSDDEDAANGQKKKIDMDAIAERIVELESLETDLRLEVTRLGQCLSASNAHLSDLERVKLNQDALIQKLEEEKAVALKTVEEQQVTLQKIDERSLGAKQCQLQMESQQSAQAYLLQRVAELESALEFHQSRLNQNSGPATFVIESQEKEFPTQDVHPPLKVTCEDHKEIIEEDDFTVGMDARIHLEECVNRALQAMERDMAEQQFKEISRTSAGVNLASPNSPSTSGCESDAGSDCRWSSSSIGHLNLSRSVSEEEEEGWESDRSSGMSVDSRIHPQKHVVQSKELPGLMKARVIYPTFSKTAVKEQSQVDSKMAHSDIPDPPINFQVLRNVGQDSLLVGWSPPLKGTPIQCYQIFVNGQLHQHARSPDRTKALLHKLDLTNQSEQVVISIKTVSEEGVLSKAAEIAYDPSIASMVTLIPGRGMNYNRNDFLR